MQADVSAKLAEIKELKVRRGASFRLLLRASAMNAEQVCCADRHSLQPPARQQVEQKLSMRRRLRRCKRRACFQTSLAGCPPQKCCMQQACAVTDLCMPLAGQDAEKQRQQLGEAEGRLQQLSASLTAAEAQAQALSQLVHGLEAQADEAARTAESHAARLAQQLTAKDAEAAELKKQLAAAEGEKTRLVEQAATFKVGVQVTSLSFVEPEQEMRCFPIHF